MPWLGPFGEWIHTGSDGGVSSFEWTIPDFFSLGGGRGDYYRTPKFNCFGGKWHLIFFPKGYQGFASSDGVSLILLRMDRGPPETLDVTLGIRGTEGVENRRRRGQEFSNDDVACFWFEFCRRETLRRHASRLMPGNTLAIVLDVRKGDPSYTKDASTQTEESEGDGVATGGKDISEKRGTSEETEVSKEDEVTTEERDISEKRGFEEWQESLLKLLESGEESDVVIKVKGKEFRAHRILLQARSPVFKAMFSHDMVEKQSGVVTMEDCDPETFPDFLKYVYTGCTDRVGAENVFGLYSASDKYDLKALKEKCANFMKKNIAVANFCETIALAVQHDEKELIDVAKEFFCANALDIVKTVEWQTFLAENTTVGNELIILSYSEKK